MPVIVGAMLALATALFARIVGLDRERSFFAAILIVVASYYLLFAVVGHGDLALELTFFAAFVAMAVLGFRRGAWWLVTGLALHGIFDVLRVQHLPAVGLPVWWPDFCLGFDVAAAICLAVVLWRPTVQR